MKQRHIEEVCKGELDSETVGRVLQWGADLVKYYRLLEPGILVTVSGHLRLSIQVTPCQVHPGVVYPVKPGIFQVCPDSRAGCSSVWQRLVFIK